MAHTPELNIALVILHADPSRGGAERYTVDLAHAVAGRGGHHVSLLATSFDAVDASVRQVPLGRPAATRLGRYLRFLDALDARLATEEYDVVHAMLPVRRCDVYHPHAGIAAEAVRTGHLKHTGAAKQFAARVANRVNLKRQRFAAVERGMLTGPNPPVVLCLSEYVKAMVRRHYDLPEERLATLFNAVDLAKFDPGARPAARDELRQRHGFAPGDMVALIIAQDFERKGLGETIRALAKVSAELASLRLLVVGKQDPARYRSLAESLGVSDRVTFAGPTRDVYACYRAADFFVLPTRHDPCSLVVLEALAMGLPVISTVCNGACEIMESGRHGVVLPDPGDVDALVVAIRQLSDPSTRRAMSEACFALRPKLAYGHHVEELLRIYGRSMRSPAAGAAVRTSR
jgi:UDP-glucose:(heptosyl)LPS alpha-1,3-glucosyltransferase